MNKLLLFVAELFLSQIIYAQPYMGGGIGASLIDEGNALNNNGVDVSLGRAGQYAGNG